MKYSEKLKDPRWQKKRLEILERDEWRCQACQDNKSTLHVHHKLYDPIYKEPWDYPNELLETLCELCHKDEKDNRPYSEKNLLQVLRYQFRTNDLNELVMAFAGIKIIYVPEVTVSVLKDLFNNKDKMEKLQAVFFSELHEKLKVKR